jgi:hypothetical protein
LQYPRLARPNYTQLKKDTDPTELIRYQIYVANMLTAYDDIFQITDEPEWVAAFEYDIPDHMPYLCEQNDPKYYATFAKRARDLVAKSKQRYCFDLTKILQGAPRYPDRPKP